MYFLKRLIQCLDIYEIFISQQKLQQYRKISQNSSAIIIVGRTGVGKTTLLHGLAGNTLRYSHLTNDYQSINNELLNKFKIGNTRRSQTRQCNITLLPKQFTLNNQQIYLIDTPGLDNNAGCQTDITNNLSTLNIIKNLNKARVIIVIQAIQFRNKWYPRLRQLVINLSNYFINIQQFSRSISIVFTKGLNKKQFLEQFFYFTTLESFYRQNWSSNQKQVIDLIKQILKRQQDQFQIYDPSTHNYKQLIRSILKKRQTQNPGQYISASYSNESLNAVQKTCVYLQKMIKQTFQLKQYQLTIFYLNNLKKINQIVDSKYYQSNLNYLRKYFEDKLNQLQNKILSFIKNYEAEKIIEIQMIHEYFINEQVKQLYKALYKSQQQTPYQQMNKLIDDLLKQEIKILINYHTKMSKKDNKKLLSILMLVKQFKSNQEYKEIQERINNSNIQIQNKLIQILSQQKWNKQNWIQIINQYEKRLLINKLQQSQQQQNNKKLKQIVQIQRNYNNSYLQNSFIIKIQKIITIKNNNDIQMNNNQQFVNQKYQFKVKMNNVIIKDKINNQINNNNKIIQINNQLNKYQQQKNKQHMQLDQNQMKINKNEQIKQINKQKQQLKQQQQILTKQNTSQHNNDDKQFLSQIQTYIQLIRQNKYKLIAYKQIQKYQFTQLIKKSQQLINNYTKYTYHIGNNNNLSVKINQYYNLKQQIKQFIMRIYYEIKQWNFIQSYIKYGSQNVIKLIQQNQIIRKKFCIIQNYSGLCFNQQQIPNNIISIIKQNNYQQFKQFQSSIIQLIQHIFSKSSNYQYDQQNQYYHQLKMRKYYQFVQLSEYMQLVVFPDNFRTNIKQIEKLILTRFEQNINYIYQVLQNKQLIQQFNVLIKQKQNINRECKQQIDKISYQIDKQKQQYIKHHELNLKDNLLNIHQDDIQKDSKIQMINKQYKIQKQIRLSSYYYKQYKRIQNIRYHNNQYMQRNNKQIIHFINNNIVNLLIINRKARAYFNSLQYIVYHLINISTLLNQIISKYNKNILKYLYIALQQHQNIHSQLISQEQNIFHRYRIRCFSEYISIQKNIQQIIESSVGPNNQRQAKILLSKYQSYNTKYQQILHQYKNSHSYSQTLKTIIDNAISIGNQLNKLYQSNKQSYVQKQHLLAYISAIWTILTSKFDQQSQPMFTCQLHPAQIIAIFLLMNLNNTQRKEIKDNCMIHVSIGQGKSLINALLSSYFALVGFSAYIASTSQYLSQKNYNHYKKLFQCLGIQNKIIYDTLPKICQSIINQKQQISFTQKVTKLLKQSNKQKTNQLCGKFISIQNKNKMQKNILLIDQIDTLFNQQCLGQMYSSTINVKNNNYEQLLKQVWNLRDVKQLKERDITELRQFRQLCEEISHPIFTKIMQNQVHGMIRGLKNYRDDCYVVLNGKIYYKQNDELSGNINYGYRTIWLYFYEHYITKRVTYQQLRRYLLLNLKVGSFSYCKLVNYFDSILCVGGSISPMSESQRQIMKQYYRIKKEYIMPSLYPPNNRRINISKCNINKLSQQIVNNIEQQHHKNRPVVIFFKSNSQLYEFYESRQFQRLNKIASIVTQNIKNYNRDIIIEQCTLNNKITLMTKEFSKGTDFKIKQNNRYQYNNEGLHIISSYLPQTFSDYIQLTGRTARHGFKGSVQIFIPDNTSALKQNIYQDHYQVQNMIKQKDQIYYSSIYQQLYQKQNRNNHQHQQTIDVYSNNNIDKVFQYIHQLNYQIPLHQYNSKIAIGIDSTGSMLSVLSNLISVIQNSMYHIYQAFKQANLSASIQIKLLTYRNYHSTAQKLIEFTNFETKAQPLIKWLKGIKSQQTTTNGALQVCLNHINNLQGINECIIISDSLGNTQQQTINNRLIRGQKYWIQHGYQLTNLNQQLQKIKQKGNKINSYYLNKQKEVGQFYKKLSHDTRGTSKQFKLEQKDLGYNLQSFATDKILQSLSDLIMDENEKGKLSKVKQYIQFNSKRK